MTNGHQDLNKTVMCNPNNSCNKIAPAKVEQFNLTVTAWCVSNCILYLLLVYTPDLLPLGVVTSRKQFCREVRLITTQLVSTTTVYII